MNAVSGSADCLTVGGRTFFNLTNLKILNATANGTTTVNGTFREGSATAGYVVPASKRFRILAIRMQYNSSVAINAALCRILYADNDVGLSSSTAFTNPVTQTGGNFTLGSGISIPQAALMEFSTDFITPTGKYPAMVNMGASGSISVTVFGYEEAV